MNLTTEIERLLSLPTQNPSYLDWNDCLEFLYNYRQSLSPELKTKLLTKCEIYREKFSEIEKHQISKSEISPNVYAL